MTSKALYGVFAVNVGINLAFASALRLTGSFIYPAYKQTPSEDSPHLSIHPVLSLDLPQLAYNQPEPEDIDIIEIERHRIEVLKRQRAARKQGGFVRSVLPSILDATIEDMDGLLRLLEHVAPVRYSHAFTALWYRAANISVCALGGSLVQDRYSFVACRSEGAYS